MKKCFWLIKFTNSETYQVWAATILTAISLGVWAYNQDHYNLKINSAKVISAIAKPA